MENLDLREILKDVPKGTKLYSTTNGEICFNCVDYNDNVYPIKCYEHGCNYVFTKEGKYHFNYDGECVLFPSKEQRDWRKFALPCQFKIGDVLTSKDGVGIAIFNKSDFIPNGKNHNVLYYNCWYSPRSGFFKFGIDYGIGRIDEYRYATQTEKNILFDKLQEKGYFWNQNNKSLERYKFKVGDVIQNIESTNTYTILEIKHDFYYISVDEKRIFSGLCCVYQDEWKLYQEKFDITTLKPYDRVLARYSNESVWRPQIFSYLDINLENNNYKFVIVGLYSIPQCIPYEGNEHLVGTANDCDEYYKTWE